MLSIKPDEVIMLSNEHNGLGGITLRVMLLLVGHK